MSPKVVGLNAGDLYKRFGGLMPNDKLSDLIKQSA